MASIARCLRAARPAGVSILAKTPRPAPAVGKMNVVRPFSVTAISECSPGPRHCIARPNPL